MTYEQIENVWAQQRLPGEAAPRPGLREHLDDEVRQRRRLVRLCVGVVILGLFLNQFFFVINWMFSGREMNALRVTQIVLVEGLNIIVLVCLLRRLAQLREVSRRRGGPIRDMLAATLGYVEAEVADFRLSNRLLPAFVLTAFISIYQNHPIPQYGWGPFLERVGMTIAFFIPIVLVLVRHYRKNLVPELRRLRENFQALTD